MTPEMLAMLRAVGLTQLSIQAATAGSLDTQAGGGLAGAGGLAAVSLALNGGPLVLALAFGAAASCVRAILGPSLQGGGPTLAQVLRSGLALDDPDDELVLGDLEMEWLVAIDIDALIRQNSRLLSRKATFVVLGAVTLLTGLTALAASALSD